MDDNREALADFVGERITVTGMIDEFRLMFVGNWSAVGVLLQDVCVEHDGKEIPIGHAWVKHAKPLKNAGLVNGDRIRCSCRVGTYTKFVPGANRSKTTFDLSCPSEVEVIGRAMKGSE